MLHSTKALLATALLATMLTACDKKPASSATSTATSTTATTTVTTQSINTTDSSTDNSINRSVAVTQPSPNAQSSVATAQTSDNAKKMPEPIAIATPNSDTSSSNAPKTIDTTVTKITTQTPALFPKTNKGNSLVTQTVKTGTPEAAVKGMMDAMMTGTPQQVASFYGVDDPDFATALAEQQPMVQQQLKHLKLGEVEYNKDKSKAIIVGKMTLNNDTSKQVGYKLQKIDGQWKLMP